MKAGDGLLLLYMLVWMGYEHGWKPMACGLVVAMAINGIDHLVNTRKIIEIPERKERR